MSSLVLVFRVTAMTLLPVVLTVIFKILQAKVDFFNKIGKVKSDILIGVVFGLCAVYGTEFGVNTGLAVVNTRDAAVLCAGLFFSGPSAIIAAVIGGVERFLAPLWGVGAYTRWACSIATLCAGGITVFLRLFFFNRKKMKWHQALSVGVFLEVFHLLLVFLTHLDDINTAFSVVKACAYYMLAMNGVAVMLASLAIDAIEGNVRNKSEVNEISSQFSLGLLIAMLLGFILSMLFSSSLMNGMYMADIKEVLRLNITDVEDEITNEIDKSLMETTRTIAEFINVNFKTQVSDPTWIARRYDVPEINIVDNKGTIVSSTERKYIGFKMDSGPQSEVFNVLLEGKEKQYIQEFTQNTYDSTPMKYAAYVLDNGGYVQVGYTSESFLKAISISVSDATKFRHVNQTGGVIISDMNSVVVSDKSGNEGKRLSELGFEDIEKYDSGELNLAVVDGVRTLFMYKTREGYSIIAAISEEEAKLSYQLTMYIVSFMEMTVFALLFICLFLLIKILVLKNLSNVNRGLSEITSGNLDTVIDIDSNKEFKALSDGINTTVSRLKELIAEASARIDSELEFAKEIQSSSVPTVFPKHDDGEIYALMDTAKEVGGDFYDFFFVPPSSLYILIADVSGKGVPAALFMMRAKTLIKNLARQTGTKDVGNILTMANETLCESNEAGMFVTCWMACIDIKTGHVTFANAGHNKPIIKRAGKKPEFLEEKVGFVLAGMDGVIYKTQEIDLGINDTIYLYTDGITEATNSANELFGDKRLLDVVEQTSDDPEEICKTVKKAADEFTGEAPQFDDMTELAFTRRGK